MTGAIGYGEGGPIRQPPHRDWRRLAELLLAAGAPANEPQAVYNRSHLPGDEWLELLLAHGLGPENEIDWEMHVTPTPRTLDFLLTAAAGQGLLDRLERLLRAGADPTIRDRHHDGKALECSSGTES